MSAATVLRTRFPGTARMPPPAREAHPGELAGLLGRGRVMVLTGAGCSTGSGIPDYRDAGGRWKGRQPMQYQEFLQSAAGRRRYWARSLVGWPRVGAAAPNAAHRALASLERSGVVNGVVTQNVDGLHGRAGRIFRSVSWQPTRSGAISAPLRPRTAMPTSMAWTTIAFGYPAVSVAAVYSSRQWCSSARVFPAPGWSAPWPCWMPPTPCSWPVPH